MNSKEFLPALELTPQEEELLQLVRDERFESITTKKRDGKIERFECTEKIPPETNLSLIRRDANYQEIHIYQNDGKLTSIVRTIKQKPHSD